MATESHAEAAAEQIAAKEALLPTDADGVVFDAAKHCINEKGEPTLTMSGRFRRRPGRRPGMPGVDSGAGNATASTGNGSTGDMSDEKAQKAKELAATVVPLVLGVTAAGFENFQPGLGKVWEASQEEQTRLTSALGDYLATLDMDVPPWVPLVLATAVYAAPRILICSMEIKRRKRVQNTAAAVSPAPSTEKQPLPDNVNP